MSQAPRYYRVRVDLDRTKPPIWRRVDLAPTLRLDEVHDVIQAAFPWDNSHRHEFISGETRWSPWAERFLCEYVAEDKYADGTPEWKVRQS